MNSFSTLERKIANSLNYFPNTKIKIKYLYQYINFIKHKTKESYSLKEGLTIERLEKEKINFFGYYDKSPIRNKNIIYHSLRESRANNNNNAVIDIKVNDNTISESQSWNWQQGTMLSWLGKEGNQIIHNDYNGQQYISKIINLEKDTNQVIDSPIYSTSSDGEFALSLNFSRLALLRPDYGYFNLYYKDITKYDKNDGIFYVDLIKNRTKLLLSFENIINIKKTKDMVNAWHKINHIMLSPDNSKFIFIHRWYNESGKKFSRLISYNFFDGSMNILLDDDMVSHACWKDNKSIIVWGRKKKLGDKYYNICTETNDFEIIGENILCEDGHPSVSPDGKLLLTDTYPDRSRMSLLLVYDLNTKQKITLGKFLSPMKYSNEFRCDLHPRWSHTGKSISFDSVHEGIRSLYLLDIHEII